LIEDIKNKLQENYYPIKSCSYENVNQKIRKYATQAKKDNKEDMRDTLNNRGTVALNILQQHLLASLIDG